MDGEERLDRTATSSSLVRFARQAAILTGLWTLPVVFGVSGHYFGIMVQGSGMPAVHIFGHSVAQWYPWIPVTPGIFAIHRRWPIASRRWPVALGAHGVLMSVVFLLQNWLTLAIGHATGHVLPTTGFWRNFTNLVVNLSLYDLFIYSGVVSVAVGLDYAKRYRDRDLRASQLETQLERARLEALQMQLQPHFLFNALNSIAMLVRRERRDEALDVVVGFGELLRYVLDEAGTMDVPLEDELGFVRRYLEIEQVRHRDRLVVEYDVAPDTVRAVVPNLVLQPLVENALKHGIARRTVGGRLRIATRRRAGVLRIEVENDGPPLPDGFSLDQASGLGLRNLRERLAAFFGDAARVTLGATPEGGVLAAIEMPFSTTTAPAVVPTSAASDMSVPERAVSRAG